MKKNLIVNHRDIVIGAKTIDEMNQDDIHRVSALLIFNSKKEVLLARRKLTKKKYPGRWGASIAGTVEEGEDYETNVVKEAKEELGLDISADSLCKGPKVSALNGRWKYFCQYYFLNLDINIDDLILQEDEVEQAKWTSLPVFL